MPAAAPAISECLSFPHPHIATVDVHGFRFCRRRICPFCAKSPPRCAAVHRECFAIYRKHCRLPVSRSLGTLRTTLLFKNPWSKMPSLHLLPSTDRSLCMRDELGGIPDLAKFRALPMEILDIIKQFSLQTSFWRCLSALCFARRAIPSTRSTQTLPLKDVGSWRRGNQDLLVSNDDRSVMKITIDSDGIRQVERLHELPAYAPETSRHHYFIVAEVSMLQNTLVYLKVTILMIHTSVWKSDHV